MAEHDVLVGFRLRLFTLADEPGNVSAACRAMGVDRSTYYRLKNKVDRWPRGPAGHIGRLSGTKGTVWQYTAIDVASAYVWAELHTSERNPRARHTRELLHRNTSELAHPGWKLREVTTDNGCEFRAKQFGDDVARLGARRRFIRAARPNSNGW